MAHPEQREFLTSCFNRFQVAIDRSIHILEVGSQDINGSVRDYFPSPSRRSWIGLDIGPGKSVDFTIPGELVQLGNGWADISISTECFEHARDWKKILLNMIRLTKVEGLILLTMAGTGRAAHGTIDTEIRSSPYTSHYYKNISLEELLEGGELNKYFSRFALEVNHQAGDTYFWGIRNSVLSGTETGTPEESLARARGQLNMVMTENQRLRNEINRLRQNN